MKIKYFYFAGLILSLSIYFYYAIVDDQKIFKEYYSQFNQSNLNDTIVKIGTYARGDQLQFKDKTVIFYPLTSPINGNNIFRFTAKKGDRVIKRPFQDTLTLKKTDGSDYKYTFMKPSK